jgi:hypothetical protein
VAAVKEAILEAVRNSSTPEEKPADPPLPREDSTASSPEDAAISSFAHAQSTHPSPPKNATSPNADYARILLDTYFSRVHGKPYYILEEASTRQRLMSNQLPRPLSLAIFAVSARSVLLFVNIIKG